MCQTGTAASAADHEFQLCISAFNLKQQPFFSFCLSVGRFRGILINNKKQFRLLGHAGAVCCLSFTLSFTINAFLCFDKLTFFKMFSKGSKSLKKQIQKIPVFAFSNQ